LIEKKRKKIRKNKIISKKYQFFYTLKKIKFFVNHYIPTIYKKKRKSKRKINPISNIFTYILNINNKSIFNSNLHLYLKFNKPELFSTYPSDFISLNNNTLDSSYSNYNSYSKLKTSNPYMFISNTNITKKINKKIKTNIINKNNIKTNNFINPNFNTNIKNKSNNIFINPNSINISNQKNFNKIKKCTSINKNINTSTKKIKEKIIND
jgi:hypothetical protein